MLGGLFLEPVLAHLPDHREFLARALERVIRALREPQRAAALAHHAALRARGGVADRLPYGEGRKALAKACGVRVDEHEVVGETREAEDERAVQPGSVEGVGGLGREGRGGEDAGAGEPLLVGHLGEEEDVRVEGDAVEGPHSQLQARESVVQRHGVSSPGGRAEVLEVAVADATTLEEGVEAVLRRVDEEGENVVLGAGVAVQQRLLAVQLDALDGVVGTRVAVRAQAEGEGRQVDAQAGDVEGQTARAGQWREVHHLLLLRRDHEGVVLVVATHAGGKGVAHGQALHLEGGGTGVAPRFEGGFETVLARLQRAAEAVKEDALAKRCGKEFHHAGFDGESVFSQRLGGKREKEDSRGGEGESGKAVLGQRRGQEEESGGAQRIEGGLGVRQRVKRDGEMRCEDGRVCEGGEGIAA